ncbi:hypothetical protein GQ53DRAFT_843817 [Thozetella sp. PMI_491]|nr:hypothetical protein GQ53DRAFT_843817 [Thozetella sp. PMI_491]
MIINTPTEPEVTSKVPGNNNAIYGPVPERDQIFRIEFLEIAPLPIPVNRIFFVYLRGWILPSKSLDLERNDDLDTATLSISASAVFPDGECEEPRTYTVPLRTTAFADTAHLSIRDATGTHVDCLTASGNNDILTDYWIPGMFLRTGMWTFEVVAKLEDGTCLFAVSLTQWLEKRSL